MEWTKELLQMPLLCGSLFFAGGMIMYLCPPKKINRFYSTQKIDSHLAYAFHSKAWLSVIADISSTEVSTIHCVLKK